MEDIFQKEKEKALEKLVNDKAKLKNHYEDQIAESDKLHSEELEQLQEMID